MKHLNKLLLAVIIVFATNSRAQNSNYPWAISFGLNAVDTRAGAQEKSTFGAILSQPFNINNNWNIHPSVSYISLSKYVGDNFSIGLQGSFNKIDKFVVYDPSNTNQNSDDYVVTNPGNLSYYAIDTNLKYSFMSLINSKVLDPSLGFGLGYNSLGDNSYFSPNFSAGLTVWFTEQIGFQLASTYKAAQLMGGEYATATDKYIPDTPSHFQHTAGLVFQFGAKDTDGDGIYDKDDACPTVAGLKQFNGCPDTDGDGIVDGSDTCPTEFGLAILNGCPDKDGDGIADKDDACPDVAGKATFNGCPDTDGDGLADKDDKCPTVFGPKSNGGCPILDTDGDGLSDKDDECPTVAGSSINKGCPELTPEALDNLNIEARSVYFDSGKSTLKNDGTPARLDAIKDILKNYPNAVFSVEGHTDSDGSKSYNKKLSEDRANAVKAALVTRGIKADNLSTVGFGETKPVATNKTKSGKANNRRTEVKSVSSKQ